MSDSVKRILEAPGKGADWKLAEIRALSERRPTEMVDVLATYIITLQMHLKILQKRGNS